MPLPKLHKYLSNAAQTQERASSIRVAILK